MQQKSLVIRPKEMAEEPPKCATRASIFTLPFGQSQLHPEA